MSKIDIKNRRKAVGYSQQELADRSRVSRATIARIETNRSTPELETVQKIAHVLDCTIDDLLKPPDGEDESA